jgi:hypothetical protein
MSGLKEVLPKFGLVYSDRGNLVEIMSKPKLIPIKVRPQTRVLYSCGAICVIILSRAPV